MTRLKCQSEPGAQHHLRTSRATNKFAWVLRSRGWRQPSCTADAGGWAVREVLQTDSSAINRQTCITDDGTDNQTFRERYHQRRQELCSIICIQDTMAEAPGENVSPEALGVGLRASAASAATCSGACVSGSLTGVPGSIDEAVHQDQNVCE